MGVFSKLTREAQYVFGLGLILLILSFLPWQQFYILDWSEWRGIGVLAGLLVIAMLTWEVLRAMEVKVSLGTLSPGLVSFGLALLTAVFTMIAFLTKGAARNWPAWVALLAAIGLIAAAILRGRAEGVQLANMGSTGAAGSNAPAAPAEPVTPAEPVAPAEPMDSSSE